jgi:hypothetical protein
MTRAMHDGTVLVACVLAVAFLLALWDDRRMRRRR